MMNGEIPSVPITTLAGISSLTDLLPELPLPTPLPQTMSNKSLLFHPRVAEEANILLSLRDENIVPLLTQSLSQTPAINIELKDHYAGNDNIGVDQQNIPELLKAILLRDPGVFNGFSVGNKSSGQWNNQSNSKTTCVVKPSVILPPVNHEGGLPLNSNITNCVPVHERDDIKRNRVPNNQQTCDLLVSEPHLFVSGDSVPSANNCPVYPLTSGETKISQGIIESDVAVTTPSSLPRGPTQPLPGLSPVQASIAPSCGSSTVVPSSNTSHPLQSPRPFSLANNIKVEENSNDLRSVNETSDKRQSEVNNVNSPEMPKANNSISTKELSNNARISGPVVVLNRLSSVQETSTAKKSPHKEPRKSSGNDSVHEITDSDDSDYEPKNKTKIFKAREKERELQRKRDKDGLKSSEKEGKKSDSYDKSKRRKRLCRSSGSQERSRDSREIKHEDSPPPKPKVRKVEKKLIPVIEKLSEEELMETNTYQRFNQSLERIFEDVEEVDIAEIGEDGDCPSEALIPRYQLQDLCSEAAKLNSLGAMDSIPINKTTRLLTILERNIRDGTKVTPISDPNDDEEERKLFLELALERVMRAVDASLTALYILTSPNMDKQVYLEDVIDRIFVFTKFQLHNTIFPAFDPVYRVQDKDKECYVGPGRKKRAHHKEVREKSVISLYAKLTEVVNRLAELVGIQILTDNAILHASTMGIAPFFVERVSDLQLACLKLVTNIFSKYDKHRKLLLDDILASMARLPSSKRSLRSYRLNGDEYIQMLTALVLQLVQCMVSLPTNMKQSQDGPDDPDVVIVTKFKSARSTASNFLYVFLTKCSSKSEEIDYRPLFENFVQDLLTTVNKPEWPAAELMLSVLGNLLVANFVNKSLEMTLRVASLDYLGVVAARLRKDAVVSQLKQSTIDQMIKEIQAEEAKDDENANVSAVLTEEERMQFLQRVLLDYLASRALTEPTLSYARHFYLAQWYQDNCSSSTTTTPVKKSSKKKKKRRKGDSSDDEPTSSEEEETSKPLDDPIETYRVNDNKKKFLLSKIRPFNELIGADGVRKQEAYIDYASAELIARYLASKRPFSQSFDVYLKHILKVLMETSVLIRTKAMKCLTSIVEVDPSVLGLKEMQLGVSHSFLDHSTSVREAAVDLVGKFVLSRPELISKYYDMLSARILDTGVSVRKRVIKILKDVCVECPDFPKIPEICVKMIRRVNDEDGIRKLVLEVFQNMWFTPVKERPVLDKEALVRKVMNITDVVAAANDMNIEWFEQLLLSMFKPREDKEETAKTQQEIPKTILTACKQIVDCLVETVLKLDSAGQEPQRLVSCLIMLHLFAKIRPQLLIDHANTLQPYLSLKCKTQADYQIISCVARTLELVVPLIEHPSEMFLARLEEDSVKLMMQQDPSVVLSCVSCLGSIVNSVTRNFALIRDCLKKYHGFLLNYKHSLESSFGGTERNEKFIPVFRRAIFVVGLLLRFFDFTDKEVIGDQLSPTIKDEVFSTFLYFLKNDTESQNYTLKAVGSVCIRHYELMLGSELKEMYHTYLTSNSVPLRMKIQVLNNIESYLLEEERKMIKQDQEWAKLSKTENLKEMGDVTSGMASTVIQIYLKDILETFLHPESVVRTSALKVIQLILAQGLVHPVQIVPYLICMSTDDDKCVSQSACKQLQDIDKKYPGFIHMKAQIGIQLSYKLQRILQTNVDVIRGFRTKEGELPSALNGFLYSVLRTKQQRRALVLSILKQFDEQHNPSLPQMLFLADNMAYFPYQVQDEPLFIIHHIDLIISITGTNLLQSFREALIPISEENNAEDEDEDEDEESILNRIPEDTTILQHCLTASQGCLLLLVLKQHLKTLYGFNDAKISQYSPGESGKVYEKSVSRKSNSKFNPKGTIQKLKQGTPPAILDEEARRALVSEYLEFKTLIMNLDPDEDDADDDGDKFPDGSNVILKVREVIAKKTEESELAAQQQEGATPKVPKLIITSKTEPRHKHRKPKTEKHKKHNHKRKRRIRSSDDSGDDYSDPDFLA